MRAIVVRVFPHQARARKIQGKKRWARLPKGKKSRADIVNKTWKRKLFGLYRAAGRILAFEHQHIEPGAGQIVGGDKTIGACAYDNNLRHFLFLS